MNATTQTLLEGLADGVADAMCLSTAELAAGFDLPPGQHIAVLATARQQDQCLALLFCEAEDEEAAFVLICQSEEGVLRDFSGPYLSYAEALAAAGAVQDGWSDA